MGNITKNSRAIADHIASKLGGAAHIRLPRWDREFGYGPNSVNGYDKLDETLAGMDHLPYLEDMIAKYRVVF